MSARSLAASEVPAGSDAMPFPMRLSTASAGCRSAARPGLNAATTATRAKHLASNDIGALLCPRLHGRVAGGPGSQRGSIFVVTGYVNDIRPPATFFAECNPVIIAPLGQANLGNHVETAADHRHYRLRSLPRFQDRRGPSRGHRPQLADPRPP